MARSEDVRQRDVFGQRRIAEGAYTSGQIEADHVGWCARQEPEANPRR